MTTADFFAVIRRRWYVVVIGAVGVLVVAGLMASRSGVYTSRVDVVLIPTTASEDSDGTLISSSTDLIALAGLVERRVNAGVDTGAATNQDVPLAGTGIRSRTLIKLPNEGGQWNYNFSSPSLVVQTVGASEREAIRRRTDAVGTINQMLADVQAEEDVRPDQRVTSRTLPESPTVAYVSGRPKIAALGTAMIGMILTAIGTVLFDRIRRPRRVKHDDDESVTSANAVSA